MSIEDINKLYEYFTCEFSANRGFHSSLNSRNKTLINNFLQALEKHYKVSYLGLNFYWNYFSFQYNYWLDKPVIEKEPFIPFHLIIGDKARERWFKVVEAKNIPYLYFIKVNLLKRCPTLQFSYIEKLFKIHPITTTENFSYQEGQRKLFLNTPRGFHNCYYHTDLYDGKSQYCRNCNSSDLCLEFKNNIL